MEYVRLGDTLAVRLDAGEEIISSLRGICRSENITAASVSGIGAVSRVEAGLYDVAEKKYRPYTFEKPLEITSLTGNVSSKDGDVCLHLHIAVSDCEGRCFGGHLNSAVISATCELFIRALPAVFGRYEDDATGLNLLKL